MTARHRPHASPLIVAVVLAIAAVPAAAQEEASITFEDQDSDGFTVEVQSATLPEGGFIVLHGDAFLDGDVQESIIGESGYLEPGTHEDVTINLEVLLEDDANVTAMLHMDSDGDEDFGFEDDDTLDGPYMANGQAVAMSAMVSYFSIGDETSTTTATVTDDRDPREDNGTDGGGDDEDTPAPGFLLGILAVAAAALVAVRRRMA